MHGDFPSQEDQRVNCFEINLFENASKGFSELSLLRKICPRAGWLQRKLPGFQDFFQDSSSSSEVSDTGCSCCPFVTHPHKPSTVTKTASNTGCFQKRPNRALQCLPTAQPCSAQPLWALGIPHSSSCFGGCSHHSSTRDQHSQQTPPRSPPASGDVLPARTCPPCC